MDYYTGEVKEVFRKSYSDGLRAKVNCYGANDVTEGVAIMWKEGVDVSITGNSTNPTRFSTPLQAHTRRNVLKRARSTSQLHQAAVQVVHFTPITWLQALLHTVYRYNGTYALRRAVRWIFLRSCTR